MSYCTSVYNYVAHYCQLHDQENIKANHYENLKLLQLPQDVKCVFNNSTAAKDLVQHNNGKIDEFDQRVQSYLRSVYLLASAAKYQEDSPLLAHLGH